MNVARGIPLSWLSSEWAPNKMANGNKSWDDDREINSIYACSRDIMPIHNSKMTEIQKLIIWKKKNDFLFSWPAKNHRGLYKASLHFGIHRSTKIITGSIPVYLRKKQISPTYKELLFILFFVFLKYE